MQYTGPTALNEGIKAIGDAFTSRPAISLEDIIKRKQLEQSMKPITLDELKAKTPPDLYEPMMKLAGSNGLIEDVNGIKFIRQHNVKDFHQTLSQNKVWQQMILDDSIKGLEGSIQQSLPELSQRKAKHEARMRYWEDQRKKAMETTDANGNKMAPNMKAMDSIDREISEYQQGDEYKQMTSLEKRLMGIKELQKRRLQSFGINEEGFKKDTEKYGPDEALKVSIYGTEYRKKLDAEIEQKKIDFERAKAGLKPDKAPTIKSVDRGNVVDIYKNGIFQETQPKGKLAGVGDSEDKASKAKEKEKNNVIAKLRAFQLKNYTIPNKSGNLTPGQIKANEDESMKVEQLIAQVQSDEVAPNKIDWPTVMKDGRLVRKSNVTPAKQDWTSIVGEAKSAIARGADRGAVLKRLKDMGYNGSI